MTTGNMGTARQRNFPSPLDVAIPPGCEGWEEMYPYHLLFAEEWRVFEESRFWYQLTSHFPEPYYPFDVYVCECITAGLSQANARLFVAPPSRGFELRFLNGYAYLSDNVVTEEAEVARRAELFARRGVFYYEHWNELYGRWRDKVEKATQELQALHVPELPEFESESVVTEGRGVGSGHALLRAYDQLLTELDQIVHYHFEFLNLGYGAYGVFYERCRKAFPGIADQTIAKMVAGIDLVTLRPDDELRRLAGRSVELGISAQVARAGSEEELRAALAGNPAGEEWLADYEQTKDPWFYFSYGLGALYHHHRSWIDDPTLPVRTIGHYATRLESGEDISRPRAAVLAERERITEEHRALLADETRRAFDEGLALARLVFPYVEDHNFYIDHRYFTIFWNKVREFGALLARHGFLVEEEDVFFLRHDEVRAALMELRFWWAAGSAGRLRGPEYWPPLVARRKAIHDEMREWRPPPALGRTPEAAIDPISGLLFGITMEQIEEWLSPTDGRAATLAGAGASPGLAEGRARVILRPEELRQVETGEILVAPTTSTSWTPVFGRIAGAVLDVGGIMSHGAIVAREYGVPAVVGAGTATKRIKTGDRIRVDGSTGLVTILDASGAP
jgi:pyruvate,water dikinase